MQTNIPSTMCPDVQSVQTLDYCTDVVVHNNDLYVLLSSLCDNIGLRYGGQRERIFNNPETYNGVVIRFVDDEGSSLGLHINMLGVFLGGLIASRNKCEETKARIIQAQQKLSGALMEWFYDMWPRHAQSEVATSQETEERPAILIETDDGIKAFYTDDGEETEQQEEAEEESEVSEDPVADEPEAIEEPDAFEVENKPETVRQDALPKWQVLDPKIYSGEETVDSYPKAHEDLFREGWSPLSTMLDEAGVDAIEKLMIYKLFCQNFGLVIPVSLNQEVCNSEDKTSKVQGKDSQFGWVNLVELTEDLGIYSTKGSLHVQAVEAIYEKACLGFDDTRRESVVDGHRLVEFSQKAVAMIKGWLKREGYPTSLKSRGGRGLTLNYR